MACSDSIFRGLSFSFSEGTVIFPPVSRSVRRPARPGARASVECDDVGVQHGHTSFENAFSFSRFTSTRWRRREASTATRTRRSTRFTATAAVGVTATAAATTTTTTTLLAATARIRINGIYNCLFAGSCWFHSECLHKRDNGKDKSNEPNKVWYTIVICAENGNDLHRLLLSFLLLLLFVWDGQCVCIEARITSVSSFSAVHRRHTATATTKTSTTTRTTTRTAETRFDHLCGFSKFVIL